MHSSTPSSLPRLLLVLAQLCVLMLTLNLTGCAKVKSFFDFSGKEEVDVRLPAKELAAKGMDDYAVGKYFTSLEYFQEILDRYPFTPEATLAELKAADCNFFLEHYPEALLLYQEFEDRHPTNEAMPYIMYQKAMCNFKQIDRVDRDTSGAEQAIQLFSQLIKAYPESPYTDEAHARIQAAREFLANHEYFVVEFYLRTDKPKEAETRLKHILAMYPDAAITPKAKELLAKIQAGQAPKRNLSSWFPKLSLPDWTLFSSSKKEQPTEE